jgi:hypothetical protein
LRGGVRLTGNRAAERDSARGARAAGTQRRWRVVRKAAAAKKGEVGSLGVRVN